MVQFRPPWPSPPPCPTVLEPEPFLGFPGAKARKSPLLHFSSRRRGTLLYVPASNSQQPLFPATHNGDRHVQPLVCSGQGWLLQPLHLHELWQRGKTIDGKLSHNQCDEFGQY